MWAEPSNVRNERTSDMEGTLFVSISYSIAPSAYKVGPNVDATTIDLFRSRIHRSCSPRTGSRAPDAGAVPKPETWASPAGVTITPAGRSAAVK